MSQCMSKVSVQYAPIGKVQLRPVRNQSQNNALKTQFFSTIFTSIPDRTKTNLPNGSILDQHFSHTLGQLKDMYWEAYIKAFPLRKAIFEQKSVKKWHFW